ncbi:hypothetical protein T492DRAFT_1008238 [Pavlovales sp. CCMP2436]|nr:hypothetical protein T492DRAFT_1008238 [Pavlovales sp. CCMP2436]
MREAPGTMGALAFSAPAGKLRGRGAPSPAATNAAGGGKQRKLLKRSLHSGSGSSTREPSSKRRV